MKEHIHEEKGADDPEERPQFAQVFGVAIDPIWPEKNLEIPEKMSDDEQDQNHAGHGHDEFLADGRTAK